MLKRGFLGNLVIELQEKLLSLGYELPKFGADAEAYRDEILTRITIKRRSTE
jgi:hypothetical protein